MRVRTSFICLLFASSPEYNAIWAKAPRYVKIGSQFPKNHFLLCGAFAHIAPSRSASQTTNGWKVNFTKPPKSQRKLELACPPASPIIAPSWRYTKVIRGKNQKVINFIVLKDETLWVLQHPEGNKVCL